jgi:hypothetical protein
MRVQSGNSMAEPIEIYVPEVVGGEALAFVDRVDWNALQHAFASPEHIAGTRRRGISLDDHPERALATLGAPDEDAFRMAIAALYQSLCHQGGTVYEATPHAVPFLAAFVAGPEVPPARVRAAGELVACMGMASCHVSERGTSAGAYGPGVGPRTRAALRASRGHLAAAQERHRSLRKVVGLLERVLANEPPDPDAVKRLDAYFA